MDGRKILTGSQLVAKGATKKTDGQLPEVGLKDVASNGSWLEQKQIQSALEARKHLIAVERIEKSGSLSHAEWRDDLKLAEVTKQTGSHWQFMGHKQGKCLYLLPEETLFLIETNSLLLKHNGVTISLQKAYSLCLSEMSITQYKVYASLSRLGYRVFRHKEPTSDKRNGQKPSEDNTTAEKHAEINTKQSDTKANNIINNADHCSKTSKSAENDTNETPLSDISLDIECDNQDLIEAGKVITAMADKNIGDTEKDIDNDNIILHDTNSIVDDKTSQQNKEKSLPTDITNNVNEGNSDKSATTSSMEVDDNANETILPTNEDITVINANENIPVISSQEKNPTESGQTYNDKIADVYSIDKFGVIRVFDKDVLMETDEVESIVANSDINVTDCHSPIIDSSTNDSFNNYQLDLKYYDDKIKTLTERKSENQKNNQGLDTIQDFYNKQIVKVNVPDETYLPRNIFLHKTEYTLNMETIHNQNASDANEETDSVESSTHVPSTDSLRLREMPRYQSINSNTQARQPRYPSYYHHRPPHYHQRLNFNNYMYRMPNFYGPRYHPNSYVRQQYMVFNVNMPTMNNFPNQDRRESMKKCLYDMIVHIAMRLKDGLATPEQVRALRRLLHTYNSRYNTNIRLTDDFNIESTPDTVPVQKVIEVDDENVIPVDDEPKRKKPRLNDDNMMYKSNLEKLKQLAVKLKELQLKKLAVSRHRRVFSNAIKTFNKAFNADIYLDSNFEIADRKTVVVDNSSDSDAVVVKEMPKKRKKLRNPYSILKRMAKDVNVGASTSLQVPVLRTLSLNVINDSHNTTSDNANIAPNVVNSKDENILKQFYKSRFSGNEDFGGAKLCSRITAQLDALIFQAEYMNDILKTSLEYGSWIEIKLAFLKGIRRSLNLQKQQVEALSSDFFTTESRVQPILGPDCKDLKSALKKLAIIPTNKEIPAETSLKIHFDVCNRDVHFKKSSPPKPNFRVICYDELAPFPSPEEVVALHAKYPDGVPTVFAFVGISASISYLQINPIDLPVFIPDKDLA